MSKVKIYHNPRCRKSREGLAILQEQGEDVEVIEYLKDVPSEAELEKVLALLKIEAVQLLRKGEAVYKEKFKGKDLSEAEWVKAMVENPKLIERPIVVKGEKAVVGRPPEAILSIL